MLTIAVEGPEEETISHSAAVHKTNSPGNMKKNHEFVHKRKNNVFVYHRKSEEWYLNLKPKSDPMFSFQFLLVYGPK